MKSGWQSTEFWITLATQILPLLAMLGVIQPGDRATVEGAVVNAITAVGSFVAAAAVLWRYIASRTELKATEILASMEADGTEE